MKHFMSQIVYFCVKTNQFYSFLCVGGGGGRPPDPTPSTVFWQYVEKERNKEVQ